MHASSVWNYPLVDESDFKMRSRSRTEKVVWQEDINLIQPADRGCARFRSVRYIIVCWCPADVRQDCMQSRSTFTYLIAWWRCSPLAFAEVVLLPVRSSFPLVVVCMHVNREQFPAESLFYEARFWSVVNLIQDAGSVNLFSFDLEKM